MRIIVAFLLLAVYVYFAVSRVGAQQLDAKFITGTLSPSSVPTAAGDVTGNIVTNKVSNIQGYPVSTTTPTANQTLCSSGGKWAPCATPTPVNVYSQIGAGNSTYGNNSAYGINDSLANESFPAAGKIVHISVQNVTGGTCTTAPTFNSYVVHGGVESDGTALAGSNVIQSITAGPSSQVENQAFVANDIVGIKVDSTSSPSGCNAPSFDVDLLMCIGPAC